MFELTPPQQQLRDRARALAERVLAPAAAETDRSEAYPWAQVNALREAGFLGMTVPEELGGQGRSYLDAVVVIEECARACGAAGRIVVETNMGAIGAILRYGSPEQRRIAAALVLAGDKPAICITEPEAGSAASQMTTRADKRGGRWIVNGGKHWITGGGVSRLHLVFARLFDERGERGIGAFIVVRDAASGAPRGLVIGAREPAMGLRGIPETELRFEDLEVDDAMLLRGRDGAPIGFGELMDAYNAQRVGAGTVALGIAQGAYASALERAHAREQFGRPIAEFQGLQWMLADMAIALEASRALLWKAAASAGRHGFPDKLLAAQAKILAAETAIRVTNDALQIWGAAGYSRRNPLERHVRDARMFAIAGGTAQILRNQVAASILGRRFPQTRDGYVDLPDAAK